MANLIPYTKSSITKPQKSAIIKADKFLNAKSTKVNANSVKPKQSKNSSEDILLKIEKKVIKIDKLLKDSFALKKQQQKKVRIKGEQKEFEDREKELEKKKPKKEKGVNLPTPPKMGFLDWIKNFITQTVLGFIAVRLIGFLPQLLKILPIIIKVTDFITDIGGKLLDGLLTFIDWGYKAYDATRGFIKNIFGEGGVKQFDQLSGLLNKFLNLAIIAGLVAAGSGGLGKKPGSGAKPSSGAKPGQGGRPKVTTSGGGSSGRPDIRNPLRQRPGVTTSGGGTGGLNIRNPLRKRPKITTGGVGKKALLLSVRPFLKNIPFPVVGALIDFGLSVALGENVGRAAFRAIGAGILAAVGAVIGSVVPVAGNLIGGIAGGILGDIAGGALYDLFFGGKKPTKKQGKTNKLAGGGSPIPSKRGGKSVSSTPTRTLKKKKKSTRSLSIIPSKIKPGKSAGGEDKVQSLFPNTEKQWWDPLGVFSGGTQEQPQQKKPTEKVSNPQEFLLESNDVLGKSNFFGPFFTLALKSVLGDKPNKLDYLKVGQGLNSWMQGVFKTGPLGFAGGGEVDAKQFFGGEDYTQVIAKSVEDSVSKEIDTTVRNLKDELSLKKPVGREEMIQENIQKGTKGGGGEGSSEGGIRGSGVDKAVSVSKKLIADLGITPAQASGIVGNFLYESAGMNPGEREGAPYGTPEKPPSLGTLGVGYGWAQWTNSAPGDRLDKFLKSYGGDKGKIATDDDNYRFLMRELKGSESLTRKGSVTGTFFPKDDPQAASDWFRQNWERAGVPADEKRRKQTLEVFNKIKGLSREQAKLDVEKSGGKIYSGETSGAGGSIGGSGKFIQWNSGSSRGVHFHIGPGSQQKGTILQSKYNADARESAAKVVDHFLSKGSTIYDGRRNTYYKSSKEVTAAQRAHSAGGSQGGIDLQVDFEKPHPFPLRTLGMAFRPNGFGVSADIAGSNSFVAHGRYDENGRKAPQTGGLTAYEKGGETLDGPHQAIIGEKGSEYVIDADSYRATEKIAPGLFDTLNYDVKDKASLVKYLPNIISSLSQYTDYENPNQEPQIVYIEVPVEVPVPMGSGSGGSIFIAGGGENNNNGMKSTLAQVG